MGRGMCEMRVVLESENGYCNFGKQENLQNTVYCRVRRRQHWNSAKDFLFQTLFFFLQNKFVL